MVISYSCFYFGPKYYRPAASHGHCHDRLLRLKFSALTENVRPRRQPDHSCMQLGPINGKHTDKVTFLLNINNVQSLYYPAVHLCIILAFITQAVPHKNPSKYFPWYSCCYSVFTAALKCLMSEVGLCCAVKHFVCIDLCVRGQLNIVSAQGHIFASLLSLP